MFKGTKIMNSGSTVILPMQDKHIPCKLLCSI